MALSSFGTDSDELLFATSSTGLSWPASVTANHLAVITISWYEQALDYAITTPPSGFTERINAAFSGSGSSETRIAVYTKECAGTESGSITVGFTGQVYAGLTLDVFAGSSDLTYVSTSSANTGSGTDATAPSVSGTSGQGLICAFALGDPPGTTNSGPSGMTMGADISGGTTCYCRTYFQDVTSSGATGTKTWDFTSTRDYAAYSLLIDGASEGGSTQSIIPHVSNYVF